MSRVLWPLENGRPIIEVVLLLLTNGRHITRKLLADTGAGTFQADFDLILDEDVCLLCDGIPSHSVALAGAYSGSFPVYVIQVQLPGLGFEHNLRAIGVPQTPPGLDGIACFRFLNRFTYGNFGNPNQFGLEL